MARKSDLEKTTKPARKYTKTNVNFEMQGLSITAADVQKLVKADMKEKKLEATTIDIYVNTEEKMAYYVVDGHGEEDYKVCLG